MLNVFLYDFVEEVGLKLGTFVVSKCKCFQDVGCAVLGVQLGKGPVGPVLGDVLHPPSVWVEAKDMGKGMYVTKLGSIAEG